MFGIVHSHIFLDFMLQGIQYKITKSIKRNDFIVTKGSYLQEITTCCSEKTIFRRSQCKIHQGRYDKIERGLAIT